MVIPVPLVSHVKIVDLSSRVQIRRLAKTVLVISAAAAPPRGGSAQAIQGNPAAIRADDFYSSGLVLM